jgi:ABC-type sugar transport system substrate-binding protein
LGHPGWPDILPETDFLPAGPWNADGLIVVAPLLSEERSASIQRLVKDGYPVVFVGSGENGPAVVADNESGIHQACRHLAAHGHRRVAYIAGSPGTNDDSMSRWKAFEESIDTEGLVYDQNLIACGFHTMDGGEQAMQTIIDTGAPFTAVLASNDESAIGAMRVLRKAGLSIPSDVAVIGFDDRPGTIAEKPPLTTVRYPSYESGYQATTLLLDYIEGRVKEKTVIKIPSRLIVRQSCGCNYSTATTAAFHNAPKTVRRGKPGMAKKRIVETMAGSINTESHHLNREEIKTLSQSLTDAFIASLRHDENNQLPPCLHHILDRVEAAGDSLHPWQIALSVLEFELPALLAMAKQTSAGEQKARELIFEARMSICESMDNQHKRYIALQDWVAGQIGILSSRLHAASNDAEILSVLAEYLPDMGIQRTGVAFFEREGDDPVAWSVLGDSAKPGGTAARFPSRQFPPPEFYNRDAPFFLALLPLTVFGGQVGFVSFDAANLKLCATIVRQLTSVYGQKRVEAERAESLQKLGRALEGAIQAMALTVEIRDPYTAGHQRRVAQLACAIALEMNLPSEMIEGIRLAAMIHDIGKINIPAEILSKPGRIASIEFTLIGTHPRIGYDVLKAIEFPWPVAEIVLQHHKRLDGSGYPPSLAGEKILLEARILGVADVVEAMSSNRPYRPALGVDKALEEIKANSGRLYDPVAVEACCRLFMEKGISFT